MKKTFTFLSLLFVLFLFACTDMSDDYLTIEITGIEAVEIIVNEEFDVKAGVVATGNDDVDYTDQLRITSLAGITDGKLNTSKVGRTQVYYDIEIEEKDFFIRKVRDVNIIAKPKEEGVFLANGDFSEGTTYWEIYDGGGKMHLEVVEGILEVEITQVGDVWEPRFSQMDIPFEKDQAYRVFFKAKADEPKKVHLQAGELLDDAPYWNDFKAGQVEVQTIGTEWDVYEFTFMMNQADNHRGGIIFEFGNGALGDDVLTKVYIEWIDIEPTVLGEDDTPPVITVSDKEFLVGAEVDLASLINVFDLRDGDIPFEELEITIEKDGEIVEEIDNSEEAEYLITVVAVDEAGNEATETFIIRFVAMTFLDENLIVNGDFSAPLSEEDPEWQTWVADGVGAAVDIEIVDEALEIDATVTGGENWHIQLFQEKLFQLVEGKSYRLSFDLKANIERAFWIEVSDALDPENPLQFINQQAQTTLEFKNYEFLFTVTDQGEASKVIFMFGTGEPALITLDNVKIEEADNQIFFGGNFDQIDGWTSFYNDWSGTVLTTSLSDGFFRFDLTSLNNGEGNWVLQLEQNGEIFNSITKEYPYMVFEPNTKYTLKFDAQASKDWVVSPLVANGVNDDWANLIAETVTVTDTLETYKISFITPEEITKNYMFKFEFGQGIESFQDGEEFIKFGNISISDGENEFIYNGDFKAVKHFVYDHSGGGDEMGEMVYDSENQQAVITLNTVGREPYIPHVYQMIEVKAAGTYNFKMVISSSVARTLRLNFVVPAWGYASLLEGSFIDIVFEEADEEVIVEFTLNIEVPIEELKFELDFGKIDEETDAIGEFILKQVLFYQVFE